MPTASQVYLALDVLSEVNNLTPALAAKCVQVIDDALGTSMWTGKIEKGCVEYGRPPVIDDPLASLKVKAYDRIAALANARAVAGAPEVADTSFGDHVVAALKIVPQILTD